MWSHLELYAYALHLAAFALAAVLTSNGSGSFLAASALLAIFLLVGSRSVPFDTSWSVAACAAAAGVVTVLGWDPDGTHVGFAAVFVPAAAFALPGLLAPRLLWIADAMQARCRYVDRAVLFALWWAAMSALVANSPFGVGRAVE